MSSSSKISVSDLLSPEAIILNITESSKARLLQFLCTRMSKVYPDIDQKQFFRDIIQRENDLSTGIGNHIAIPHAISENAKKLHMLFATHAGIEYNSLDGKPVHIIFMLAIPPNINQLYSSFLMQVSTLMRIRKLRDAFIKVKTPEEIIKLFKKYENMKS